MKKKFKISEAQIFFKLRTAPPAWKLSSLRDFCSGNGNRKLETETDIGCYALKGRDKYRIRQRLFIN